MFVVYALKSQKFNYIYIGLTNNLERRFQQHNSGRNLTTRAYRPFVVIYSEIFKMRIEARSREKFLKSGCGREWLKMNSAQVAELVYAHV